MLRIRSDSRESRRTIALPTHSQAASVATITLITASSTLPWSKLCTESPSVSLECRLAPSSNAVATVSSVTLASENRADSSRSLPRSASC